MGGAEYFYKLYSELKFSTFPFSRWEEKIVKKTGEKIMWDARLIGCRIKAERTKDSNPKEYKVSKQQHCGLWEFLFY
jgi:hypothetical protein